MHIGAHRHWTAVGLALVLQAFSAAAEVDVNRASEADLDGVKGIGPALSRRILAERAQAPFSGWNDLIARVKGIGPAAAGRLSSEGLTVNGSPYSSTPQVFPPPGVIPEKQR